MGRGPSTALINYFLDLLFVPTSDVESQHDLLSSTGQHRL